MTASAKRGVRCASVGLGVSTYGRLQVQLNLPKLSNCGTRTTVHLQTAERDAC